MSDAPNYFKFHLGDFSRDCEELSLLQEGAYLRLMRWYYSTGKPLPNDLQRIHRRCYATSLEERSAVDFILGEFFKLDGKVWRHKRIDEELAAWRELAESARYANVIRWEKERLKGEKNKPNKINVDDNPNQTAFQTPFQNPNHNHNHILQKQGQKLALSTLSEPSDEHRRIAAASGVECSLEFAKYTDWLKTNGKRHKDQHAGFRNWLRKAGELKPKQSKHDALMSVAQQIWKGQPNETSANERDIIGQSERLEESGD